MALIYHWFARSFHFLAVPALCWCYHDYIAVGLYQHHDVFVFSEWALGKLDSLIWEDCFSDVTHSSVLRRLAISLLSIISRLVLQMQNQHCSPWSCVCLFWGHDQFVASFQVCLIVLQVEIHSWNLCFLCLVHVPFQIFCLEIILIDVGLDK